MNTFKKIWSVNQKLPLIIPILFIIRIIHNFISYAWIVSSKANQMIYEEEMPWFVVRGHWLADPDERVYAGSYMNQNIMLAIILMIILPFLISWYLRANQRQLNWETASIVILSRLPINVLMVVTIPIAFMLGYNYVVATGTQENFMLFWLAYAMIWLFKYAGLLVVVGLFLFMQFSVGTVSYSQYLMRLQLEELQSIGSSFDGRF